VSKVRAVGSGQTGHAATGWIPHHPNRWYANCIIDFIAGLFFGGLANVVGTWLPNGGIALFGGVVFSQWVNLQVESSASTRAKTALAELEAASGIAVEVVLREMGPPPDIPPEEKLGRLSHQYGFEIEDVRIVVANHTTHTQSDGEQHLE
jgi:hypothetical protein